MMHGFNVGNAKSHPGDDYDWAFFECGENLTASEAARYVREDPDHVYIRGHAPDGKFDVRFKPKHPMCRFRAFKSLLEGVVDYLLLLHRRFALAWPDLMIGDPRGFSHHLKVQGYYTADEATYTQTLVQVFSYSIPRRLPPDWDPLSIDEPYLTDDDKERINGLMALTAAQSLSEVLEAAPDTERNA
jgi:hypothetical protein